ncbi:MAG: DUF4332 domain-containing protein [Leptospirales bacterium]|nr:DUF4332 domain-containing protein [Leptospirales bacterium]
MAKLNRITGIDDRLAEQLRSAGVTTIEKLLEHGESREGRRAIAIKARINERLVQKWVHHADFFRIKGIAGLKAELLGAVGVPNVRTLAKQNPDTLYEKMVQINGRRQMIERVPGLVQVRRWVKTAQKLKPAVY